MKVIYYYSQINVGGAERSTIRLLNYMKKCGWDVTLLLRWDSGKLEHELDLGIKKIYLKKERKSKFAGKIGEFVWILFQYLMCKIREKSLKNEHYDIAINGLLGANPRLLFKAVKAEQYYQMLRNDVEKTGKYGKTEEYMKKYGDKFDRYIGVSSYTTESFKRVYPDLQDRAEVVYNIIAEVETNAQMTVPKLYDMSDNKLRILTLGRLEDRSKGLLRMVDVAKALVNEGIDDFVWYVVGDGPDRGILQEHISKSGLEKVMILCGGTTEPLAYYKYADLVAVLSYYEGLCGVVNETKIMERPLIATRFSGITEQITDGINGYIVENNTEAIIEGMKELLKNRDLINKTAINGLPEQLRKNDLKIRRLEQIYAEVRNK